MNYIPIVPGYRRYVQHRRLTNVKHETTHSNNFSYVISIIVQSALKCLLNLEAIIFIVFFYRTLR